MPEFPSCRPPEGPSSDRAVLDRSALESEVEVITNGEPYRSNGSENHTRRVGRPSLHFGNQAAMVRWGTGPKALWLCVTDFRRVCRFEKHLLVGAETPKNETHRWVGC